MGLFCLFNGRMLRGMSVIIIANWYEDIEDRDDAKDREELIFFSVLFVFRVFRVPGHIFILYVPIKTTHRMPRMMPRNIPRLKKR